MRKSSIILTLIGIVSSVIGYTVEYDYSQMDPILAAYHENGIPIDREDVIIDADNNKNITADVMYVSAMYPDDLTVRSTVKGLCEKVDCTIKRNEIGPFYYNGNKCYLHRFVAGKNDYIKVGPGYRDFYYNFDLNGHLKCAVKKHTMPMYRKFNFSCYIGPYMVDEINSQFSKWLNKFSGKSLYDGKNILNYDKFKVTIRISECAKDVYTFNLVGLEDNCDTDRIFDAKKNEVCGEYTDALGCRQISQCVSGLCCGKSNKCGSTSAYCSKSKGCQSGLGDCN